VTTDGKPASSDTYMCGMCHETYELAWTEREAREEAAENFPGMDVEEQGALVCDDCYRKVMGLPPMEMQS
jgi:hypothetical protein